MNEEFDFSTFAGRIRFVRTRLLKLPSHRALAAALAPAVRSCSPQAIQSIESGRSKDSRLTIHIANLAGVDPVWLATGGGTAPHGVKQPEKNPITGLSQEAIEIARLWQSLPEPRRRAIKETIFLEAFLASRFPWLRMGRPEREIYAEFERRVVADMERRQKKEKR